MSPKRTFVSALCLMAAGLAGLQAAQAGNVRISTGIGTFSVPAVTLAEARFETVVRQQRDYSCGSASIATLLTYHYEDPVTEADVFKVMWENGDQERIEEEGFSLLDMKTYLEERGYRADGFRTTLDKISEVTLPAIVVINTSGYKHFVVVKGIRGDEVIVGDPALGTKIYPREEFEAVLDSDIIFLIHSDRQVAEEHFNHDRDWAVRPKAPFGTALSREGLSQFTLLLPTGGRF